MSQQQNWEQSRLQDYLLYDEWDRNSGFRVLVGFDYDERTCYPGNNAKAYLDPLLEEQSVNDAAYYCAVPLDLSLEEQSINDYISLVDHMRVQINRLEGFWNNGGKRDYIKLTPSYFIEWAISKNFRPPWLDWAIEHKLYEPNQELNSGQLNTANAIKTYNFDPKSTTYPIELELACQAWRAVSSTNDKGKPKARIEKWLKDNTKLSESAIERISIVANWEKTGGATPTK